MPRASYRTCDIVSEQCPVEATTYGYYPDLGPNAFFAAFFGVLFLLSLGLGVRTRTWTYTIALGIGAFGECVGYIGRIMMYNNPWSTTAFEIQICCLVLSPSFIAASIYLTLKHLVLYCGPEHSRLKPRLYPWVFVGCDLGSIILQAIGGGVAASAGPSESPKLLKAGDNLIVAGIAFQVATMSACGLLVLDFLIRFRRAKASKIEGAEEKTQYEQDQLDRKKQNRFRMFCASVGLAYLTVLIRCIYRLPEMAGGWGNPLMRKELEFLLLDGMMLAIAVFALTCIHPGVFFAPMRFAARKRASSQ